jgi:hypothetical protein
MANAKTASRPAEINKPKPSAPPAKQAPAANPAPQPVATNMMQELKVTGHFMALPAGLFCIVNEAAPGGPQPSGLPGVRISLPPNGARNVEITGFRPDGWLSASGDAALVKVNQGPAQILVTIYQMPNAMESAPKLQVRQLLGGVEPAPAAPPAPAPVAAPAPAPAPAAAKPEKVDVLAHIQTRGDVGIKFGEWLGERGSQNWIEGFAIAPPEGISAADLSYQAVLGRGWLSPWVEAGQYCGSRGMALPLLGLRIRLQGAAASAYDLTCSASFIDGTSTGPVSADETCESESLAPLEALKITLTPKARKPAKAKRG